jgi:hypothetical protein
MEKYLNEKNLLLATSLLSAAASFYLVYKN